MSESNQVMRSIVIVSLIIGLITGLYFLFLNEKALAERYARIPTKGTDAPEVGHTAPISDFVDLAVPYVSQLPDQVFVKPWSAACEEASIVMVEQFYLGNKNEFFPKEESKQKMNALFTWEDANFGFNDDTDASSTARLINERAAFTATVKSNPTLEEIKNELKNNRLVISMHDGRRLNNPYLHFSKEGPGYHVIVLKGYDNEKKEFIAHDPGTHEYSGDKYRYSYETIMSSLHDYDVKTKKAENGIPVVLFTSPDNR